MSTVWIPLLLAGCLLLCGEIAVLKNALRASHVLTAVRGAITLTLVVMAAASLQDTRADRFMLMAAWLVPGYVAMVYLTHMGTHPRILGWFDRLRGSTKKPPLSQMAKEKAAEERSRPPFELKRDPAKPSGTARTTTFAELYTDRKLVRIDGEITNYTAQRFATDVQKLLDEGHRAITVELHTPGGSVNDAWSIHERLRLLNDFCDVQLVVMGVCMSAGVSIMMALPVQQRWATRQSEFMIHGGKVRDNSNTPIASLLLSDNDRTRLRHVNDRWVVDLIVNGTAIAREDLEKLIVEDRDVFVSCADAVHLGVVGGTL